MPGEIAPALLILPFVAAFGKTFSHVLFGVFIGSLNAAMMCSLVGRLAENLQLGSDSLSCLPSVQSAGCSAQQAGYSLELAIQLT
jgi:hypothetical protein